MSQVTFKNHHKCIMYSINIFPRFKLFKIEICQRLKWTLDDKKGNLNLKLGEMSMHN